MNLKVLRYPHLNYSSVLLCLLQAVWKFKEVQFQLLTLARVEEVKVVAVDAVVKVAVQVELAEVRQTLNVNQ